MAENQPTEDDVEETVATKYYKSSVSGLSIIVAPPSGGEVQPERVQFTPYEEIWQGDPIKVGYLETDNAVAQERLANDPNVESISKSEYTKATDPSSNNVKRLPL